MALALVLAAAAPGSAVAATIHVTGTGDGIAPGGGCTLREAVQAANTDSAVNECPAGSGADTIVLGAGRFTLTVARVAPDTNGTGDLDLTSDMTIRGAGAGRTTIDANGAGGAFRRILPPHPGSVGGGGGGGGGTSDRVFHVHASTNVTLEGLTITGGTAPDGASNLATGPTGASGDAGGDGGGILNDGTLTVAGSEVTGNSSGHGGNAGIGFGSNGSDGTTGGDGTSGSGGQGGDGGNGGGIFSSGALTVTDSTVSGNTAGTGGTAGQGLGGHGGNGSSGNGGNGGTGLGGDGGHGGNGGGIAARGALTVVRSNVSGNTAGAGGTGGRGGTPSGGGGPEAFGGSTVGGTGGTGGQGLGGFGGDGGSGGGIDAVGSASLTLTDTTLDGNAAGGGGAAGFSWGGAGGSGTAGTSAGGAGGQGFSAEGGVGGSGGGLLAAVPVTASGDTISGSASGDGGAGGAGVGGPGGDATAPGGSAATGGAGGLGFGSLGGPGGTGGGAMLIANSDFHNSTWSGNRTGRGGNTLNGTGGHGGQGAGTGNGGAGGNGESDHGGDGGDGGGIDVEGVTVTLVHQTVASNSVGGAGAQAPDSGGAGGAHGSNGGSDGQPGTVLAGQTGFPGGAPTLHAANGSAVTLSNSILVQGDATGACGGANSAYVGGSHNIVFPSAVVCPGATAADPRLYALADNGGPTRTRALRAGSAAVDVVPSSGAACAATDQRGVSRPHGTACDAGAYEVAGPDVTTTAATAIKQTTATLGGQIAPSGRGTSYHFEYGKTSAYGSRTADADAGAGLAARSVSAPLTGLSANTTYHFRLVATNADGTSAGADRTFKTAAPDRTPPVISAASVNPAAFAINLNGPAEQPAKPAAKKGTAFRYTLSEPARVVFTIESASRGRRVGGKCRKQTAKNRKAKRCTLYKVVGRFAQQGKAGPNLKPFSGRIGTKTLKPGHYRATLIATDAARNHSKPKRLTFTVVKK